MRREKVNILDFLFYCAMLPGCGAFTLLTWSAGQLVGGIVMIALTAMILWFIVTDLRNGLRPPTRWEQFKAWMTVRPLLIGAVGVGTLAALPVYGDALFSVMSRQVCAPLLIGGLVVWAVLTFYCILRAPHRFEADAAYRRRVRYRE